MFVPNPCFQIWMFWLHRCLQTVLATLFPFPCHCSTLSGWSLRTHAYFPSTTTTTDWKRSTCTSPSAPPPLGDPLWLLPGGSLPVLLSPLSLPPARGKAPCWGASVSGSRCVQLRAPRRGGNVTKANRVGGGTTYLCYRLFIPHGRLLDEAVHFHIPIPARDDHSGLPETHGHFHSSSAGALIPMRKKPRQSDKNHPRTVRKGDKLDPAAAVHSPGWSDLCVRAGREASGVRSTAGCRPPCAALTHSQKLPN